MRRLLLCKCMDKSMRINNSQSSMIFQAEISLDDINHAGNDKASPRPPCRSPNSVCGKKSKNEDRGHNISVLRITVRQWEGGVPQPGRMIPSNGCDLSDSEKLAGVFVTAFEIEHDRLIWRIPERQCWKWLTQCNGTGPGVESIPMLVGPRSTACCIQ